ncbi:MAG: cytosine permease [Fusicatenibacter saccharivorans]
MSVCHVAIPVSKELLGGSTAAQWGLVILAGVCMTASAYFGIESLTIVSYIAVPSVAILGTSPWSCLMRRRNLFFGSFVSGGTATPNFARFAKNGKAGAITTVVAFFIGNSLMFFFGAVSSIFVGGNDIFEVMVRLNLFYLAVLVLGLNIWTTNDNALYTAGLGLANIFHQRKKPMVLLSGIIGTVASVWLYYNFCGWLNILNCTLPPVGMILVLAYFMNKEDFETDQPKLKTIDWFAVAGVILGAIVANLLHWGIASINGMVVAAVCYCVGQAVNKRK